MEKELNAEQIKKALRVCWDTTCSDCEFDNHCEGHWQVLENACDLINSYEQKIKELTEENERLRVEEKQSQILIKTLHDKLDEGYAKFVDEERAEERADTVRKMQERLKAKAKAPMRRPNEIVIYESKFVSVDAIDQIAKEMLEGV